MADAILRIHRRVLSRPFQRAGAWWYVVGAKREELGAFEDLPPTLCAYGPFSGEPEATASRIGLLVRLIRLMAAGADGFARMLDPETWVFIERQIVPSPRSLPIRRARAARP